jgi:hypothetical protein
MREDIRPDGWIPNPEIEERVKTKMKDSKVRVEIERRLQQAREQEEKKSFLSVQMEAPEYSFFIPQIGGPVSAWPRKEDSMANTKNNIATTTQDKASYALQRNWVLDSGASCHVCNDRIRFTSFKPITDSIRTGDSQTDVSGIGEVRIRGKRPCTGETVVIKLSNVLYSPNFLTNPVSLKLLRDQNVKWDSDQDILVYHRERIAKIEFYHGMWVIEHNEMETALVIHRRQREAHQPLPLKKPNRSSEDKDLRQKAYYMSKDNVLIFLRTYYNPDDDDKMNDWFHGNDLFEDNAWWACLNDPNLFDFGPDWRQVYEIMPEVSSFVDCKRRSDGPSKPEHFRASPERNLHTNNQEGLHKWRDNRSDIAVDLANRLQNVTIMTYMVIADQEAFQTGQLRLLCLDDKRDIVRDVRVDRKPAEIMRIIHLSPVLGS